MNPPQVYMCSPSWSLLPPPSPFHPSGSSQCTSPKHPVFCIEPGLATRFIHDILHVSMPFSQIFPSSPSPTESIRLFYTLVSLLLSCTQGYSLIIANISPLLCISLTFECVLHIEFCIVDCWYFCFLLNILEFYSELQFSYLQRVWNSLRCSLEAWISEIRAAFFFFFFKLENNWFTMLCWFLPYNMNQS